VRLKITSQKSTQAVEALSRTCDGSVGQGAELGCVTETDIVQLVYRPTEPQGASKDYEFSRASMEKRWQQGASDARAVLHASPWLAPMPKELGVRVFDVACVVAAC
jgi:patatin-like phospholipase